jgi:hypothetical protein
VEVLASNKVGELSDIIQAELEAVNDVCADYQEAIVFSNLRKPEQVTEFMIQRWKDELSNRRQYLSYLQSLFEDVSKCGGKVASLRDMYLSELDDLGSLVGGRNSVPKEHVYPKFDKIARLWNSIADELEVLLSREGTLNDLADFKGSYTATLNPASQVLALARDAPNLSTEEEAEAARAAVAVADGVGAAAAEEKAEEKEDTEEKKEEVPKGSVPADLLPVEKRPQVLSVDSTPEFMQLPLEYQGFCCWTITNRGGLLLPGKPGLGVVQYNDTFYVFAHEVALQAFLDDPVKYCKGVKDTAMKSPELIHLLRLQNEFPNTAIAKLMGGEAQPKIEEGGIPLGFDAPKEKKDQSTETPTHFIEKNIDPSYEWNSWGLRRRALQTANLRKCKTTSQQTDNSHMRRENDSQVYLPKTSSTMTKTSTGTCTNKEITYVGGLRGDTSRVKTKGVVNLSLEIKPTINKGTSHR